jgi:hypothetical protein
MNKTNAATEIPTFTDVINSNVWAAIDQRHDTKNYASVTEVIASYLQNAMDTCREYKMGVPSVVVWAAFCAELARAWETLPSAEGRIPDGFRA